MRRLQPGPSYFIVGVTAFLTPPALPNSGLSQPQPAPLPHTTMGSVHHRNDLHLENAFLSVPVLFCHRSETLCSTPKLFAAASSPGVYRRSASLESEGSPFKPSSASDCLGDLRRVSSLPLWAEGNNFSAHGVPWMPEITNADYGDQRLAHWRCPSARGGGRLLA